MSIAALLAKAGIKNDEVKEIRDFLSTGIPELDFELSGSYVEGGIPMGAITLIEGPSAAGKTAIATAIMANCQKRGGIAVFQDHEKAFALRLAKKACDLSDNPEHWVYKRPHTYEESWDQVKETLYVLRGVTVDKDGRLKLSTPAVPYDIPIVVVFDSLASMTPQSKFAKDSGDQTMKDKLALAAATSATMDVMATIAEVTNTAFVFLNQVREAPGVMYGDATTTPGGKAPEFYASCRIRLAKKIIWDEKTKQKVGTTVNMEVIKNKIRRPFGKAEVSFYYQADGTGKFDTLGSTVERAVKAGVIEQSGSWSSWDGKKFQSRAELKKYITENGQYATLVKMLDDAVSELERK